MKYFNLNIRHPLFDSHNDAVTQITGAAAHWLGQKKKAVVYFGLETVQDIMRSGKPKEAFSFILLGGTEAEWSGHLITTIQNEYIWIFRPAGPVQDEEPITFERDGQTETDILKTMSIEVLPGFPKHVSKTPLILANMKAALFLAHGTFREIGRKNCLGNIAAIQAITKIWEQGFKIDPLECLSSTELETLVAKLFEAQGCFVPAYRGGTLAGVDLFATPKSRTLAGLDLDHPSGDSINTTWSIQVKKSLVVDRHIADWLTQDRHLIISLGKDTVPHKRHLNREWIHKAIAETPSVHNWLAESLDWLPVERQEPPLNAILCKSLGQNFQCS